MWDQKGYLNGIWGTYITNPSHLSNYRNLNKWSGQGMALQALGLVHPSHAKTIQYIVRANTSGEPAGYDYPAHHSTFYYQNGEQFNWDRDFWNDHWSGDIEDVTQVLT